MHFDSDQTDVDSAVAIGDDRGAIGPRSRGDWASMVDLLLDIAAAIR